MSCLHWLVQWRAFVAAAIYFRPFLLTGKDQRIKADIKGLTHMATVVGEPVEPPLPHVGRACAPNLDRLWHSQSKTTLLSSLCVIDSLRIVESGICEARSNPFMTDSCKICFPKKTPISFSVTYPTASDNKRLQSTTNVCSTAWS